MKTVTDRRLQISVGLATGLLAILLLFSTSLQAQAIGELIENLKGADANRRAEAAEKLGAAGAEAIAPLMKVLEGDNAAANMAAQMALATITHRAARPGADEERAKIAQAISKAMQASAAARAKNVLLENLSTIGGAAELPAIVAALENSETQDMACFALARIPAPEADQAARKALASGKDLGDRIKIALINGIAAREDTTAAPLLADIARSEATVEVRMAAIEGLARNPMAYAHVQTMWNALNEAAIGKSPRHRSRLWDCFLLVAEAFVAVNEVGAASDMLCDLMDSADSTAERCSTLFGLSRGGRRRAPDVVLDALEGDDPKISSIAVRALGTMRGLGILSTVEYLLEDSEPAVKIGLLECMGMRREEEAALLAAGRLEDEVPEVRAAALQALEGKSFEEVARGLLAVIEKNGPAAREGAVGVLGRLQGDEITAVIVETVEAASPEALALLLPAVARSQGPAIEKLLIESTRSENEAVRLAAYRSLATLGNLKHLPVLLEGLDRGGAEALAAAEAIDNLPFPAAVPMLIKAAAARSGAPQASLVRVLGKHRDPGILEFLLSISKKGTGEVRIAALQGLCNQQDERVLPILLEAATAGPEKIRPAAVLGCLRLGQALEKRNADRALAIYHRSLSPTMVAAPDDRRLAVAGLGRLASPRSIEVLKPLLSDRSLRQPAAEALLAITTKLGDDRKDDIIEILKVTIPLVPGAPDARAAVDRLRRLGVTFDIAAQTGFITHWRLLGPLPNPANSLLAKDLIDPEKVQPHSESAAVINGKKIAWKHHHTLDPQGLIDLTAVFTPTDSMGAYAYTEVTVPEMKRVSFKFGSDDSMVCWLNDKRVHSYSGARGVTVDQDTIDTKLEQGTNRILIKILNEGGGWGFCMRITDRAGAPVKVKIREE